MKLILGMQLQDCMRQKKKKKKKKRIKGGMREVLYKIKL